jgi:transcriptional regulator with XRE-family HTH domain
MDVPPAQNRIRAAREYAGLSRSDLARRLGYSAETIARYERGYGNKPPRDLVLVAIADECRVPHWFILDGFDAAPAATVDDDGGTEDLVHGVPALP